MVEELDAPLPKDDLTFSSAEVCLAVGLPRPTFDAWMLRGYMSLPPGPGTGRARRFSITSAVRLAVTAELSRLGVSVSVAARASSLLFAPFQETDRRIGLLLMKSPAPEDDTRLHGPAVMKLVFKSMADVMFQVALRHGSATPSFIFLDVTDLAERTMRLLDGNANAVVSPDWLERCLDPGQLAEPRSNAAAPSKTIAKRPAKSRKTAAPKA